MCQSQDLPAPEREFQFAKPDRKWRFDFCWPDNLLALEVEGGAYSYAGHRRIRNFINDMEKYNAAALHGYRLIRVTPDQVKDGTFLHLLVEFFKQHSSKKDNKGKKNATTTDNKRKSCPF